MPGTLALACSPNSSRHGCRTVKCGLCCSAAQSEQAQHPLPVLQTRRAALASMFLLTGLAAPASAEPAKLKRSAADGVDNSTSPLVQRLLESSASNKDKYNKERLDSYYRRNLREFFASPASVRGLSAETKQRISEWLEKNPA
ncbi:hypothetical protein WJX81_006477 [Elliptochloris bilobata]|uniref:Uncharacterized protein n=1 Tax=Elliptochloris bilobata TaxID=381761 RepID=A0AAW1SEU6_9CHLO